MLDLLPDLASSSALRVLCIGAHCDDIEIGCGGVLQVLQKSARLVTVDVAVLTGSESRQRESRKAIAMLLKSVSRGEIKFGGFRDGYLPAQYEAVKHFMESLKHLPQPDMVFCHEHADRHQDHRVVNEVVWSTFRDHLIFEYEIPKWDGGLGQPNVYVPMTASQARKKARVLVNAFQTQGNKGWFKEEVFLAMLRLRGVECRAPSGYAEAFYGRKLRISCFQ